MCNNAFNSRMMKQITNHIMMIRPVSFRYNEETAINNYYQKVLNDITSDVTQERALKEFNHFVSMLRKVGVNVIIFNDSFHFNTPDSIFPNNWVSFHANSMVGLYPMYAVNRRNERRKDILDLLVNKYHFEIKSIKDFTYFEVENKFLEGTGSMVLDRVNKICYAALSVRTDKEIVKKFCSDFNYTAICFTAKQDVVDRRMEIYHTNVMMCIANNFAVVCLDSIDDLNEKDNLIKSLNSTGKDIIEISEKQKNRFAGNMLQVMGKEPYLVMSTSAYQSLNDIQIKKINNHCAILHAPLDTIEACGGGSARCMMAEIFLPKKK